MLSPETLEKIENILLSASGIQQIILFGSQARDTADNKSDVDILVITCELDNRFLLMRELRRKLLSLPYDFDVIAITPEEYERDKNISGTIARYASQDGKVIYAA